MNHLKYTTNLLIFTDMDGSLLDHHTYSHADADALLTRLETQHIPVIPNTSKTAAELVKLRDELHNQHPFIAENGAAVYIPKDYFTTPPIDVDDHDQFWVKAFTQPRQHWQKLIATLQDDFGSYFTTFAQAGISGIMEMTGLNQQAATLAAQREFGEPIAWQGTETDKQTFITQLQNLGANVLQGGRFMHISGQCDKGQALQWLTEYYQTTMPTIKPITLAIGDSQNDIAMLEAAEIALIIRSPVHPMPTIKHSHCYRSTAYGPIGWTEGVQNVLNSICFNCKEKPI